MAKGVSINIGLNTLNTTHYGTGFNPLRSCLKDAQDMATLAKDKGFEVFKNDNTLPLVGTPKAEKVIEAIKSFSGKDPESTETPLAAGDTLLVTFAGHGGRLFDVLSDGTTAGDEPSGFDQTWCLFDRQILDDELAQLWSLFAEGVRIIFISDSCYCGTVAEMASFVELDVPSTLAGEQTEPFVKTSKIQVKSSSKVTQREEAGFRELTDPSIVLGNQSNRTLYQDIRRTLEEALAKKKLETGNTTAKSFRDFIKARVISITACQDNQKAKDGQTEEHNGVFTAALITVTELPLPDDSGNIPQNYESFHGRIKAKLFAENEEQVPNFLLLGNPDSVFEAGPPFKI